MSAGQNRPPQLEYISAITLATHDMAAAVVFYSALGFAMRYGGETSAFTSFHVGNGYLNLVATPNVQIGKNWGRVIFYVANVDDMYRCAVAVGLHPEFGPRDAPWGERYFHLIGPDGHELSFAAPLSK